MGLHGPFGHLQHTLWQKERPKIKLAVWFPTTKSRKSAQPQCACRWSATYLWKVLEESYKFALDLIPIGGQKQRVMTSQSPESLNWDSGLLLGSPRTKSHSMWVPQRGAKNIVWGKVVASPESKSWWILWVQSCPWLVLTLKVLQKVNQPTCWLVWCRFEWVTKACHSS
jgi:hypothetical protein